MNQKRFPQTFPPPAWIHNQILNESTIPALHKCDRPMGLIENQNGQLGIVLIICYQPIVPVVETGNRTATTGIGTNQQIMGGACIFVRERGYADIGWPCRLAWLFVHRQFQMEIWQPHSCHTLDCELHLK
ncbi:hypothetical protein [Brucella intermedia]|uniref:hypothetical protein n=1 Tax=Brucella intermedia TaxID=94625 RepID=UPI001FFE7D97|nr:hypothetical protein [Brucella intermedia]